MSALRCVSSNYINVYVCESFKIIIIIIIMLLLLKKEPWKMPHQTASHSEMSHDWIIVLKRDRC
ncbi:MAG: hypothetical protein N7Q72_06450, partial [Spiroplasma sp. Tabriz.8]|nr:hypothetical protein [Spiroplasma sp. Tabriz.8]